MAKRLKNEWRKRRPKFSEIAAAQKLAKRVDAVLLAMMNANVKT